MKTLKVCLVVGLIFIAGVAGGVVATRITLRRFVQNAIQNPEVINLKIEREMARKLRLNPQQRVEVRAILTGTRQRLKTLRQDFQPQFTNIVQDARTQISAVLTTQQKAKFEEFQTENQRFLQW